jgi:hypothetical protein
MPTTRSFPKEGVTMATLQLSIRRLILAGGFTVAVAAAPAFAVFAASVPDATPVAQCPGGEEADQFTGMCVPHTVPNSGASPYDTEPGNPDVPTVNGIPCIGHNSGQCVGLAENEGISPSPGSPSSSVSSSP